MKSPLLLLSAIGVLCCASILPAQVLMIDFGPFSAASPNTSPYHTVAPTFSDTTWNLVQLADIAAGVLKWSDNTTAINNTTLAGITLNLGQNASTAGVGTLDLDTQPVRSLALGGSINTGVYTGATAGRDGILPDGTLTDNRAIGFQVGGLAAGTYDIYVTGRNTNVSTAYRMDFYAGKSSVAGDFDFSGYTKGTTTYTNGATHQTAAWVAGENFVKLTVTLSSGEFLNVASIGVDNAEKRGFLNSVQIVNVTPIPEPASAGLLLGLAAVTGAATLRRRRHD